MLYPRPHLSLLGGAHQRTLDWPLAPNADDEPCDEHVVAHDECDVSQSAQPGHAVAAATLCLKL